MENYNKVFYKYLDRIGTILLPAIIAMPIVIGLYNAAKEYRMNNSIIQKGLELKVILDNEVTNTMKLMDRKHQ